MSKEKQRLDEITSEHLGWRRWGPYVSDRAWGTVREDYSDNGDAWSYFTHEHARARTYRWGEDGIAGLCDRYQFLCFAPAFWNGKDRILKERLFGVTPSEGNHGEDVKEYYFHIDNTPTHSYMKLLYKYPQAAYPYERLVTENQARQGQGPEFELLDTGVFAEDRYFDIFIEYAKATPEDICIRIEAFNRGPESAPLHILPHLWYRNTWGWRCDAWGAKPVAEPIIELGPASADNMVLCADDAGLAMPMEIPADYRLGKRYLSGPSGGEALFTDNETNAKVIFGPAAQMRKPHVKDAFHRYILHGEQTLNLAQAAPSRRCIIVSIRCQRAAPSCCISV